MEEARGRSNITLLPSTVVTALEGTDRLTGLVLKNTATGEVSRLPVSALFEAVGQQPETRVAAALFPLDPAGFLPADTRSRVPPSPVSLPPGTAGPRPSAS